MTSFIGTSLRGGAVEVRLSWDTQAHQNPKPYATGGPS